MKRVTSSEDFQKSRKNWPRSGITAAQEPKPQKGEPLMSNVVQRSLDNSRRTHAPAGWPTIAAISIVLLSGLLSHSDSARTAAAQTIAKQAVLEDRVLAMHAALKRARATAPTLTERTASAESDSFNSDQGPGPGPIGPGPGCNLFPAPASVGASVPLSYFGPPPSDTNRSLVGPVQLLNTGQVDAAHGTITIPLYLGHLKGSGKNVWYILTDVDNADVAAALGLNFSAKLTFASHSARTGNLDADGNIVFDAGTVNFAPERKVIPGPPGHEFPPTFATPGEVGDANYGPLVRIVNAANVIYNAPMVAFDVDPSEINFPHGHVDYSRVHDQVVAIDPFNMTVTLNLINGFSFGRPVWYLSTDASIPLAAAIEHNTFAPLMQKILLGHDDSFASPVERIFISTNGPEAGGCDNPLRQGLSADLADGHRPNNVIGGIPTIALDYSPYWDAQLFEWTEDAIDQGFRGQVREEFQILTFVQDGLITGPGGKKFGSSGFAINCPIVQRLD
jgi:hypothetical protein